MQKTDNELWCIVLVSTTIKDTSPELTQINLDQRRQIRKSNGITGLCIYASGNILMSIEGEKNNVKTQFELIKKYSGHHSVIKLYDGSIPFRFFQEDPLAFKVISPEAYKHLDEFQSIEKKEYLQAVLETEHLVTKVIQNFIKNNN